MNPNYMNSLSSGSAPFYCIPTPQLARAYVLFQYLENVYPPMKGLERGTIFPELDMPYGANPEYTVDA